MRQKFNPLTKPKFSGKTNAVCAATTSTSSTIWKRNRSGPSTESYGTPHSSVTSCEIRPAYVTRWGKITPSQGLDLRGRWRTWFTAGWSTSRTLDWSEAVWVAWPWRMFDCVENVAVSRSLCAWIGNATTSLRVFTAHIHYAYMHPSLKSRKVILA